jgi:hypothetical protein
MRRCLHLFVSSCRPCWAIFLSMGDSVFTWLHRKQTLRASQFSWPCGSLYIYWHFDPEYVDSLSLRTTRRGKPLKKPSLWHVLEFALRNRPKPETVGCCGNFILAEDSSLIGRYAVSTGKLSRFRKILVVLSSEWSQSKQVSWKDWHGVTSWQINIVGSTAESPENFTSLCFGIALYQKPLPVPCFCHDIESLPVCVRWSCELTLSWSEML